MTHVKIQEIINHISTKGSLGVGHTQVQKYQQLIFAENSTVVSDDIFDLKQDGVECKCIITKGRLRLFGAELLDYNKPIYIVDRSDRFL